MYADAWCYLDMCVNRLQFVYENIFSSAIVHSTVTFVHRDEGSPAFKVK